MTLKDKLMIAGVALLGLSVVSTQGCLFYLIHEVTKPNAEQIICPDIRVSLNGEDITEHGVTPDEKLTDN